MLTQQLQFDDENEFNQKSGTTNKAAPALKSLNPKVPFNNDKYKCKNRYENLVQSANSIEDKARLTAVSSEHASDWLNCVSMHSAVG